MNRRGFFKAALGLAAAMVTPALGCFIPKRTYSNWRNYTFRYTKIDKEEFLRLFREAAAKMAFEPPCIDLTEQNG